MSAGSSASNLGYGNHAPFSNANGAFVNKDSSNWGVFTSNTVPGLPGLSGAKSNVDAANGVVPGICLKGGTSIKRKIKNITRYYKKMNRGSKRVRTMKRTLRRRHSHFAGGRKRKYRTRHRRHHRRSRHMSGGYSQYQNNMPLSQTYKVGGVDLPASQLGLANPPPITTLPNCTNCVDNYNHYTNQGFPSRGH